MPSVFVGRERELAELVRIGLAAMAGDGAVVLLAGEAGIGKTALLERVLARIGQRGVPVLTGRALADEGVPEFWPWRRVLEQAVQAGVGEPGPDCAPGLGPHLVALRRESELDPVAAVRFRAFERTTRALRAAAEPAGLIIALEDLHWADTATLDLLRYLCGELGGARLLVVGTYREPDGGDVRGLATLAAVGLVHVVRLAPLDVGHVAAYLRSSADNAAVDDSWAVRLHRHSGGNPLFVRELTGLLAREWLRPNPDADLPVPPGLRRVVAHRLASLGDGCRNVLAGCAAIGEEIDIELLTAADQDAAAHLGEAVAAGVLLDDPSRPRILRFSHDVVRQVCYHGLGRSERVAWHGRIAEALQAAEPDETRLAQLARHRIRSAVDGPGRRAAVSACRRAAEAELRRLAFAGAGRWYDEALELSDAGAERCELLLGRAEAAFRDGQVDQALDACTAAMEQAERLGRADLAAASALVVRGIGGEEAGLALAALCERAFAVLGASGEEPDTALEARLLAQHSMALAEGVSVRLAEPISRRAMDLAERSGDPIAVIDALNSRRLVLTGPEGIVELTALGRRMREASALAERPEAALWAHIWRIDAAMQQGLTAAMDAEIFELTKLVERLGWPLARWHLLRVRANRAVLTGRFTEAERLMEAGRTVARQTQDASAQNLFYSALTSLLVLTGATDRYADDFRRIEDHMDLPLMLASRSAFHVQTGDAERAAELFERCRSRLEDLQPEPSWTATIFFAGEAAARLADPEIATMCYRRLLPYEPYYVNLSPACNGSVARVLGLLAGTLGDLDAADAHLSRAVAMETRIGALPFVAVAQLDHATLLARRRTTGDRDRAVRLAEAAGRTARSLGMAPVAEGVARLLGELSGVRSGPATLTPQEKTIAGHVARGRTNQQIAAELVVSVRTVETHVRNILRKVGLTNRTELAAWALRHRLGA